MSKKDFEAFSLKTKGATLIQDPKKLKVWNLALL
jgi:hypothetical protein